MRKVLVLGAAGKIAHHAIEQLLGQGGPNCPSI